MAARANWKGVLKIGELACGVALYTAASTAERIAFHILNRKTGHRVHRQFVDGKTGKPVEAKDQVKGYETGRGDYVQLEPEEVARAIPESDKTLSVQAILACGEVDDVYFDRPYYLAPSTPAEAATFAAIREAMKADNVAAIARAVLFRRVRSVLIRAHDRGLIATTLKFDYEVRSSDEAFGGLPDIEIGKEMRDLALHIIRTKRGKFDPKKFTDRYEAALAELVKAKMEGRPISPSKPPQPTRPSELLEALRQSADEGRRQVAAGTAGKTKRRSGRSRKAA